MCTVSGTTCNAFWHPTLNPEYKLMTPRQLTLKASDGTTLYASLMLPPGERTRTAACH